MPARWPKLAPGDVDQAVAEGVVVLDFFQETCPPCHVLEPRLEAFASRHRGELEVKQVDIDANEETPQRFGVMSIPTVLFFRDGQEVARLDGLIRDEDLKHALAEAKAG